DISLDPDVPGVTSDGQDISDEIRSTQVASHVSAISSIIPIRHVLIAAQRAYIAGEENPQGFSNGAGIVVEGRDITTV
ncbi:(d)CMP kinase, partial [Bifidobacterium breve]